MISDRFTNKSVKNSEKHYKTVYKSNLDYYSEQTFKKLEIHVLLQIWTIYGSNVMFQLSTLQI